LPLKSAIRNDKSVDTNVIKIQVSKLDAVKKISIYCSCFFIPDKTSTLQKFSSSTAVLTIEQLIDDLFFKYTNSNKDSCVSFLKSIYSNDSISESHFNPIIFPARFACIVKYNGIKSDTITLENNLYIINRKTLIWTKKEITTFEMLTPNISALCRYYPVPTR
jgi:hypothetical protein